ncbi:MAG: hypothetical protein IPN72_22505 [Saprospiraceae bacterium]|nr:hypothetical protein [Saprospiraceae bacterium]
MPQYKIWEEWALNSMEFLHQDIFFQVMLVQKSRMSLNFFGVGLSIRFSHPALIRVMGNQVSIQIDDNTFHDVSIVSVRAGAILKVLSIKENIGYLTVEGGWKSGIYNE